MAEVHGVGRQVLARWRQAHGLPRLTPGPRARIAEPSTDISEAEMLRQRVRELEAVAISGRKEDVLRERMVAALKVELRSKEPTYKPRPLARRKEREEHEMALLWSDTHAGEVISREETNGLNAYDWQEMMRRHDEILRGVLSYVEHRPYPIRRLHVWALGDMLSGNIHDELAETNEFPIVEAAVQFGLDAAEWLERFVPEFKEIRFAGVVGNHPRMHAKPRAKQRYDNMDWLVYHTMQQRLRAYDSIKWQIPKAQKWPVEVCGRRVLLTHGDGIRSTMVGVPWGGIIREFARLSDTYARAGQPFDHLAVGHWHEANAIKNRRILVNGSVKGVDEYSIERLGGGEPPAQMLVTFHPKRGLTDVSFIDLA
jgi:predicted phosphodiesterase